MQPTTTKRLADRATLRSRMVDGPTSIGARARARRWDTFERFFPSIGSLRVLDLGGTCEAWRRAPVTPAHVTVLNLTEPGTSAEPWLRAVEGDACRAAEALEAAGVTGGFDLVFSNSLLEHVGGHANRVALAAEVHALAPAHWVQTPYRYFPIEPHWLFPGLQFMPLAARATAALHWPLQHTRPATRADALTEVQWTEMVGLREMRGYFPHSQMVHERVASLTKSLTAVRTA